MSCSCKNICDFVCNKQCQRILGYANGQRYCKTCSKYFVTESIRCTCCNQILRKRKRHNKIK